MPSLINYLAENGWALCLGVTAILTCGILGIWMQRSPIGRQRFGEGTVVACLFWLLLPCLPISPPSALFGKRPVQARAPAVEQFLRALPADSHQVVTSMEMLERRVNPPGQWSGERSIAKSHDPSRSITGLKLPKGRTDLTDESVESALRELPEPLPTSDPPSLVVMDPADSENQLVVGGDTSLAVGDEQSPSLISSATWLAPSRVSRILAWLYLSGAVVALSWLALGHVLLVKLVRRSQPIEISLIVAKGGQQTGRWPRILASPTCRRAMTFGVFRPTIVVPQTLANHKALCGQLEHVVLHELGHVRQRDAIGQGILNVAFVLLFFHPLYWIVRRQICFDRELVIDDWAAQQTKKQEYIANLVKIARSSSRVPLGPSLAMGAVNVSQSQFYRRIKMLVDRNQPLKTKRTTSMIVAQACVLLSVLLAITLLVQVPTAHGQEDHRELQNKIDQLAVERESLAQQVRNYRERLKQLEDVVAQMRQQLAMTTDRAQLQTSQRDQLTFQNQQLQEKVMRLEQLLSVQGRSRGRQLPAAQNQLVPGGLPSVNRNPNNNQRSLPLVTQQSPGKSQQQPSVATSQTNPANQNQTPMPTQIQRPNPRQMAGAFGQQANIPAAATASHVITGGNENLVQLATNYADALAEREIAKAELHRAEELVTKQAGSKHDLMIAKIRLEATIRKAEVMRHVAEATQSRLDMELQHALEKLSHTKRLVDKGFVSKTQLSADQAQVMAVEANLMIMSKILEDN